MSALGATDEKPPTFCSEFPSHLDPVDIAIKFAGAGGDGAQTAAILLTQAAINEGFDATDIPSYGPESRGGTSYADVHVAKDEVLSPAAPTPHVLLAFNAPSLEKFASSVAENGIVIYDSSVISTPPDFPTGVKAYGVPCGDVALKLGNKVVKNIVALGALQEATRLLTDESILTVLRSALRRKPNLIEINEKAYAEGVRHVEVFFDPQAHTDRGVALEAVVAGLVAARAAGGRRVRRCPAQAPRRTTSGGAGRRAGRAPGAARRRAAARPSSGPAGRGARPGAPRSAGAGSRPAPANPFRGRWSRRSSWWRRPPDWSSK